MQPAGGSRRARAGEPRKARCSSSAARPGARPTGASSRTSRGDPFGSRPTTSSSAAGAAVQAAAVHHGCDFARVAEAWGLGRGETVEPDDSVDRVADPRRLRRRGGGGRADDLPQPRHPGLPSRPQRVPGRRRVLPGDLLVHPLPRRPCLPVLEPGGLDADRQRARPPVAARPRVDPELVVARHLRPDHPPPRRHGSA